MASTEEPGRSGGSDTLQCFVRRFCRDSEGLEQKPSTHYHLTLFGRHPLHPQVNDVVGDFTSLSLLEVTDSTQGSFEARARQLQEQLWKDLDHRYVGGVQVQRDLAKLQGENQELSCPWFSPAPSFANNGRNDHDPEAWLGMLYMKLLRRRRCG